MILEAIEVRLRTDKSEKIQFGEPLTIEHLLPQAWKAHYELPKASPPSLAEAERNEIIHSFGNLTLLTKSLNPSVSNGPWQKKRTEILKHSALALNRPLADHDTWNEDAIKRRGQRLFGVARKLWPSADDFSS